MNNVCKVRIFLQQVLNMLKLVCLELGGGAYILTVISQIVRVNKHIHTVFTKCVRTTKCTAALQNYSSQNYLLDIMTNHKNTQFISLNLK